MTEPPPRPRGLLINVWIAGELVSVLLDRNLVEEGVQSDFYGTLSVIGVWGPLTPSDLAERTGTPLTTVSDRLRRMVADGDVERVAHPEDGRSHLVRLTTGGDARWRKGWWTNKVTKTGKLGYAPCGIAAGAGSLWIDGYGTAKVERVNPKTLKVVKRIRVGINVWDVAFAFGSVWATNNTAGSVSRIDPATNRVVKTIKTGVQPSNFAVGKDALWVGSNSPTGQDVYRIDPVTNTSVFVPTGHDRPSGIIVSADAVWTASGDNTVSRLDLADNSVAATVKVGANPQQGAQARDGTIWVPNKNADTISVIDPAGNAVVRTVKTGPGPFVVNTGFGDIWVGSNSGLDLWRIRP